MSERKLNGYLEGRKKPTLSFDHWINQSYQDSLENYLKDSISLKPTFIRIRNQVDYLLFGKLYAKDVRLGKDGHFFRYTDYFVTGGSYPGDAKIENDIKRLKQVQNELRNENKFLLFVIAPDKLWIYEEFLNDPDVINEKSTRLYKSYLYYLKKHKCDYIDLNAAFLQFKKTKTGLLFSKGGYHWTEYGAFLGLDSIYQYVSHRSDLVKEKITAKSFVTNDKPWYRDRDMMEACNLQFIPALNEKYTHPVMKESKNKIPAIICGDSFCQAICWTYLFKSYFDSGSSFWYYNREIYDVENHFKMSASEKERQLYIDQSKIYIVLYSAGNLEKFDYGFLYNFKK